MHNLDYLNNIQSKKIIKRNIIGDLRQVLNILVKKMILNFMKTQKASHNSIKNYISKYDVNKDELTEYLLKLIKY